MNRDSWHNAISKDVTFVSNYIRKCDREEFNIGGNWKKALLDAVHKSEELYVICYDDIPYFLCGIVPVDSGGVVWACGTDDVQKHVRYFLDTTRLLIAKNLNKYKKLFNFVWSENVVHVKWLGHMGFSVSDKISHGDNYFHYFEMEDAKCVAQQD